MINIIKMLLLLGGAKELGMQIETIVNDDIKTLNSPPSVSS